MEICRHGMGSDKSFFSFIVQKRGLREASWGMIGSYSLSVCLIFSFWFLVIHLVKRVISVGLKFPAQEHSFAIFSRKICLCEGNEICVSLFT